MKTERIGVLFIGGYSRSGSTLLDRMLGQIQGFCSVGELKYIWERGLVQNQLCGCGVPFRECEFWRAVLDEAFQGPGGLPLREVVGLSRAIDRLRNVPRLLMGPKGPAFREQVRTYRRFMSRLYMGIQKVSGDTIIVDSSKDPSHGLIIAGAPDIDLSVIHLVRDSRAVAYSWMRKKPRPEIHWKTEYMPRYHPAKTALWWNIFNLEALALKGKGRRYRLLRYEDLIADPYSVLLDVSRWLGQDERYRASSGFINGTRVYLQTNHTVSGNPIRFQRGAIDIRPDIEWQERMDKRHQVLVTALTWPLLASYGYLSGRPSPII